MAEKTSVKQGKVQRLVRCPFCGKSNLINGFFGESRAVVCHFCGAQGPFCGNESAAQNAWNTRAPNR